MVRVSIFRTYNTYGQSLAVPDTLPKALHSRSNQKEKAGWHMHNVYCSCNMSIIDILPGVSTRSVYYHS